MVEDINSTVEEIEQHIEGEIPVKTKKRKDDIPLGLTGMTGTDVIRIMEFLHKKYLSWLREAESTKYVDIVRSIREETVSEINKFYSEIFKAYEDRLKKHEEMMEKLTKMIDDLYSKISVVKEGEQEKVVVKQSVLDDPRVRVLGYILYESLSQKNETLQKYKPIVQQLLLGPFGDGNVEVENNDQRSGDQQS